MDAASIARDLLPRLRRWTPANWTQPATPPADSPATQAPPRLVATRAEVAVGVVQRIADLAADAEGQPRRTVPRLGDVVLADQLAVLVDDALRTGSPETAAAVAVELIALGTALGYS